MNDYALYKGDKFIAVGTKEELAKILGVQTKTISFYASPTYRKRTNQDNSIVVIKVEEE